MGNEISSLDITLVLRGESLPWKENGVNVSTAQICIEVYLEEVVVPMCNLH